jgi:hypothetical protein
VWPKASRGKAYRLAAEFATKHPALVFRNPELLAWRRERQREERRHFHRVLRLGPGGGLREELAARMAAYWQFRLYEVRDAEGRSAADRFRERYGHSALLPDADLPADLGAADTVGVVYDEVEGNCFWADVVTGRRALGGPESGCEADRRSAGLCRWVRASVP